MKLVVSERRVLEHLTNNGATTKPELMVATGYSKYSPELLRVTIDSAYAERAK